MQKLLIGIVNLPNKEMMMLNGVQAIVTNWGKELRKTVLKQQTCIESLQSKIILWDSGVQAIVTNLEKVLKKTIQKQRIGIARLQNGEMRMQESHWRN